VVGWQALLKMWVESGSAVTYLVGKPFGSGYNRYASETSGQVIGFMPHNLYVQLLYRGGLLGLGAFLWAVGQGVRTCWSRLRRRDDGMAPLLFAMLVAQLVYYVPYGIDYAQMLTFGLLLGMVASEKKTLKTAVEIPKLPSAMRPKSVRLV
jgi:O-antigen ligase